MPYDFKKAQKALYSSKAIPEILEVPPINYIAVRGHGDPNKNDGAYQNAIQILYAVSYTLKMSHKGSHQIDGFFEYVVPPLEGFWQQNGISGVELEKKDHFSWIAMIRLPDFVSHSDFRWAAGEATRKKQLDCSPAEFLTVEEGLCVQALHTGPFDSEPETIALLDAFLLKNGYQNDFSETRLHHEIYLSDPRKTSPEKWKTVIRHPIRKVG